MTISFQPDWTSAPGDTITRLMRRREISAADLGDKVGLDKSQLQALLAGRTAIQLGLARSLSETLGGTPAFWMARDWKFRQHTTRNLPDAGDWLGALPVRDMQRLGWIDRGSDASVQEASCLRFFGVSTIEEWRQVYLPRLESVALKRARTLTPEAGALSAWLRRGEIIVNALTVRKWDPIAFASFISSAHTLTRNHNPTFFLQELSTRCAATGVGFAFVESIKGCPVHGAAFKSPSGTRIIMLSPRLRTLDHFWFSFLHEAGHLLLHDSASTFVDGIDSGVSQDMEDEANCFAEDHLLPTKCKQELLGLDVTPSAIARFAKKYDVSSTIVLGQLEYYKRVPPGRLNHLKHRFEEGH